MENTVSLLAEALAARGPESSASDPRAKQEAHDPGRVTLHVGTALVAIDRQPSVALSLGSLEA